MNIIPFLLELHISEHPIPRRMNPDLLELVLCMQLPALGQNYLEEIGQNIQNLMERQGDTNLWVIDHFLKSQNHHQVPAGVHLF
jgi:hypothetical protein